MAVVALAALIVACGSPFSSVDVPSPACGGFHLKVVNGLSESVQLNIGTDWTEVIEAGKTETLIEFLTQPDLPRLPWLVEIYDATGRVTLFRQTMSGTPDQMVILTDSAATASPLGSCGQGA